MSEPSRSSDPRHSRRALLRLGALLLLPVAAVVLRPGDTAAQTARLLDAPRAAGLVGERFDGYAVTRGNVTADITALVAKVNAERQAVYAQRAATEHVSVDAIGRIYAAQIIQSAPAGTWFFSETGQWSQK
jgi:uncharacterized protein YdbL (DUF1318 family)